MSPYLQSLIKNLSEQQKDKPEIISDYLVGLLFAVHKNPR